MEVGGTTVPHFQVMLGGMWKDNAGAYGLAIGAVPSKRVPEFLTAMTDKYLREREKSEASAREHPDGVETAADKAR